jgi:hypothetical protein
MMLSARAAMERMTRNGVTIAIRYVEICHFRQDTVRYDDQKQDTSLLLLVFTYEVLCTCQFRLFEDKNCTAKHL